MINEKSLAAVRNARFSHNFCRPLYSNYCFSQIPASIISLLTGEGGGLPGDVYSNATGPYDHVILLFLDGFGWTFMEKYQSSLPFFRRLEKEGMASMLTSMFPSTTAAHVTCINTGLVPCQSGLYEWFIYEPTLNDIIAPLPFCFAGEQKKDSLLKTSLSPEDLYPRHTLYQSLAEKGIQSTVFQPASILDSTYSKSMLQGAKGIGYDNIETGLKSLLPTLQGKTYSMFYFPDIDSVGHREGVHSEAFGKTIERAFTAIESIYSEIPGKTALMITADHGMTSVSPQRTFYINKKIPNIEKYFLFGNREKPLAPAGSCRDLFLHLSEDRIKEAKEMLEHFLKGIAEVHFTKDLIEEGLFGNVRPAERFLNRVGNLVILPYKDEAVWWWEKNRFQQNFYAAHGGLTREEMEIPFLFFPIN
ncbi:MAG: hypothetical protein KR126chlam1_01277 [Chlamydiae bacterium]|nr:hypothetical protein [Chlamydiota bacterium]